MADEPAAGLLHALERSWSQLLGVDRASPADDFFELGGDSLVAVELMLRLHKATGLVIDPIELYALPRFEDFAQRVTQLAESAGA